MRRWGRKDALQSTETFCFFKNESQLSLLIHSLGASTVFWPSLLTSAGFSKYNHWTTTQKPRVTMCRASSGLGKPRHLCSMPSLWCVAIYGFILEYPNPGHSNWSTNLVVWGRAEWRAVFLNRGDCQAHPACAGQCVADRPRTQPACQRGHCH